MAETVRTFSVFHSRLENEKSSMDYFTIQISELKRQEVQHDKRMAEREAELEKQQASGGA